MNKKEAGMHRNNCNDKETRFKPRKKASSGVERLVTAEKCKQCGKFIPHGIDCHDCCDIDW